MIDMLNSTGGWFEHGKYNELRTWMYAYDGYVFGATYDIRDAQAKAAVQNLIHLYNINGTIPYVEGPSQLHPFTVVMGGVPEHGMWVESHTDHRTTWLYPHDGVVFGAGYDRPWYP